MLCLSTGTSFGKYSYVKIIQINGLIIEITLYHYALFVLINTQEAPGSRNRLGVTAIVGVSAIKTKCNTNRTVIWTSSFACDGFLHPVDGCRLNLLLKGAQVQREIITCRRASYGGVPWWFGRSSSRIGLQLGDSCWFLGEESIIILPET
jgi:hypothetical protein